MSTTKQEFLHVYDSRIEEVFSYFYTKTSDREQSKCLSQKVFTDIWDYITQRPTISSIDALVDQFKITL